jgi:hypothetical protein
MKRVVCLVTFLALSVAVSRLAAAALVALATGIGTVLSGKAYEELKAWFFALLAGHAWTAYLTESNPSCTTFSFADREKAFDDVAPYEYNWHVMRVGDAWSGEAYKRGANGAEYYLNGINRGTYTIINYSSKKNLDGIGAYILLHRPGARPDADYYVGYWVGRECSIQGNPLILCPMVLVHKDVQETSAKKLMPQGRCQLAEPTLP